MNTLRICSLALFLAFANPAFSQSAKKSPPPNVQIDPAKTKLTPPASRTSVPTASHDPFNLGEVKYRPLPALQVPENQNVTVKTMLGESGLPILFKGKTNVSTATAEGKPAEMKSLALEYLISLKPEAIKVPGEEFRATNLETDAQGKTHVRLEQIFKGVPVFGGEVVAHAANGSFEMLNGRYYPSPEIENLSPGISPAEAFEKTVERLGVPNVKLDWTAKELALVGGKNYEAELVIYHKNEDFKSEKLAWLVTMHPNLMRRWQFFVDAQTGEILKEIDFTCKIDGGRHAHQTVENQTVTNDFGKISSPEAPLADGPVTCTGLDLLDQNRTFGGWQKGSTIYMEDASKSMFNSGASVMPDEPVGAVVTLDAFNTSPEVQVTFNYDLVSSTSTTFSNKKAAVSVHWNSIKCFDYFKATFNRNSIDGNGGNIVAFANVSEADGSSMENAFWNGDAMWYGNGGSAFKPLARGLDVGGHEMTHGVVEKTANLIYENESGALNESFADVFGAMIDRDDWKIGEDVMQPGVSPNNALRSLQDPHNGASGLSSPWWQPKHVSEKYTGSQDNGGVHINSGIPNHAFFLFATNAAVGKDKAEQVYYKALKDYLTKSSKFVDCRIAVIQAAQDLYGQSVATAAASAFDAVGITGSAPSGNYLGQLQTNPGEDFVLCVSPDFQSLDLADGTGNVLGSLYGQGLKSRPSVTDNGSQIVFVNAEGHIIYIDLVYTPTQITPTTNVLSDQPVWRNAAISKDGRFLAALLDNQDNKITVYDLADPFFGSQQFFLYNPTYTPGVQTNDVKYADVMEFDYSGNYIMYDAFTENTSSSGDDISYWDVGFLQFWGNNDFANGDNLISKLFNGLPEKVSIGNPTFSKNSPFIIAFDLIDGVNNKYGVYGANIETGDLGTIIADNGDLGWPNYNRLDNKVLFESEFSIFGKDLFLQNLAPDKISAQSGQATLVEDHVWGVWYANGNRNLQVSTGQPTENIGLNVSPNPVVDVLSLDFSAKNAASAQVSVLNLLGQTFRSEPVQVLEGENRIGVSMAGLEAGTYLVRLQSANFAATAKVVKL